MSDDTITTPAPEPAAETPEAKAKRTRTTFPWRILRVDEGALYPMRDSPEFSELREALAWISAHGTPGMAYRPARLAPAQRLSIKLEEIAD